MLNVCVCACVRVVPIAQPGSGDLIYLMDRDPSVVDKVLSNK